MDLSNTAIPPPLDDDDEDVHWALSTASALWSRGERAEALKWLRRAAETASDANADERALTLFKAAADVTTRVDGSQAPPAPPAYAPLQGHAPAAPPAPPAPAYPQAHTYPQPPQAPHGPPPQAHAPAPAATPAAPPVTAGSPALSQRAPRPASVPAPASAAAPRPASVPAPPAAPRPLPPARPSTPGVHGAPNQPFELQRLGPGVPPARPPSEPAQTTSSPPAGRVNRPIHAPPVPVGAAEPSSIRQTPPAVPRAEPPAVAAPRGPANEPPSETPNETHTARARVRRPPPSEVDTLKQPRPQLQSQVPTSRPPADVRPMAPVHVPPAPISGSSALERPFVDRTPSQVRSRPGVPDEDITAQRNLADFPGMGFDDLDEETNVLGTAAEHAQLFAQDLRAAVAEDEDRTGELDEKGDATVSTRPGKPPVDLGSTQPDSFEPPRERPGTRRTVDIPPPGSAERRGPVLLQGVRVAVLAGVRAGELRVVALEPDAMAPPGGVPAVLLALSPENGSAILRMLNEE